MDPRKLELLYSVSSLLQYHQSIGIDGYPSDETTSSFMQAVDVSDIFIPAGSGELHTLSDNDMGASGNQSNGICEGIENEIRTCTDCVLHKRRLSAVPGHGGSKKPKLLIVGGWLVGEEGVPLLQESIFGIEEDRMVSRMLSAINLSPEEVFITNVIKCAVPDDCQPSTENILTCFSFLKRQIQMLNPVMVCAMGIVATKALLKNTQPLSQLRGRVYPFAVSEQQTIHVVPTYHPTFLLENPGFKKATWEDLQIIAKSL